MTPRQRAKSGNTRAALYARVSTLDQTTENQLIELRRYAEARGWTVAEYVDSGISGSKERRPALDQLMADAKRRTVDVIAVWRLDRFGRNLGHLIKTLDELRALDVGFCSLGEGIDTTTPVGRMNAGILGAIAEFERSRIVERVNAGIARARRDGKRLGRRPRLVRQEDLDRTAHLSIRAAAETIGVPRSVLQRARVSRNPCAEGSTFAPDSLEPGPTVDVSR